MADKNQILFDDFEEDDPLFTFGLFSTLPDFKLSYQINSILKLNLSLEEEPYTLRNRNYLFFFNLFSFKDPSSTLDWFLIGNQPYKGQSEDPAPLQLNVFEQEAPLQRPLIKKESNINYFFQVYGESVDVSLEVLKKQLKTIKGVQGLVQIEPSLYKEGQNLYLNKI
ncbi:MAG: hypothetical protein SchgKO_01680 [Schleiferiaceae bacterium]|jgi:hypothetical protein